MAGSWGFPARKSHASSPAARTRASVVRKNPMSGAPKAASLSIAEEIRDPLTDGQPTRGPARSAARLSTGPGCPQTPLPRRWRMTENGDGRVPELGTILGVWAHPDDEAYLTAGLMAQAVRDGRRVVCVTATRGEEGSWDEERWPTATLGEVRQAELERCLEILGVEEHHWLDYYDGTCGSVDPEEGVARVAALMDEVRPDSLFTF